MKKFTFSLQKLLRFKEQVFETERNILTEMRAVLQRLEEELEELRRQHRERTLHFRETLMKGTTAQEMELHKTYLRMLERMDEQKVIQIQLQRQAVEAQMDKVREAKMEIATMEKLRERKLEEYNYFANKAEEQFIEEFVNTQKAMSAGITR